MAKVTFRAFLNPIGEAVLQMELEDEPVVHQLLDAGGLTQVIQDLMILRGTMTDEVSREIDPGSRLYALTDPLWRGQDSKTPGFAKLLALRHPGFGWLTALFPEKEARGIAAFLLKDLPTPPE